MKNVRKFAFFDLDDTLLACKTMFSFQEYWYKTRFPLTGHLRAQIFNKKIEEMRANGTPREEINRYYYTTFAGRKPEEVKATARAWYREQLKAQPLLYVEASLNALRQHQMDGVEPVLVSGSMVDILAPIIEYLGVRHVLATRLTMHYGAYTGKIVPPQTIGEGKAEAIRRFLLQERADGQECFAYGDHISDVSMLEMVGNPVVVSDEFSMKQLASVRGWGLLSQKPTAPRASANVRSLPRPFNHPPMALAA